MKRTHLELADALSRVVESFRDFRVGSVECQRRLLEACRMLGVTAHLVVHTKYDAFDKGTLEQDVKMHLVFRHPDFKMVEALGAWCPSTLRAEVDVGQKLIEWILSVRSAQSASRGLKIVK